MTEFQTVPGFEDVWRPPTPSRRRTALALLSPGPSQGHGAVRARLARIVRRAPEVMVKVSGRTADAGHLRAHLGYISRNGGLAMEDRDGAVLEGHAAVADLAEDWSAVTQLDSRRRANTPFSLSVVLSMPQGTDAARVHDAARAFAREVFADRFDYVFVLHTDAPHPHVHLAVRTLGDGGARLNPKKAELETWRQVFAQALRDRGVEAEATPRRARGVTRKAERTPLRKMRERHEAGGGAAARVLRLAYRDAARAAFQGPAKPPPWELRIAARQRTVRGLYLAQARLLQQSSDPMDRALGEQAEAFVRGMPPVVTARLALAKALREANRALSRRRSVELEAGDTRRSQDRHRSVD